MKIKYLILKYLPEFLYPMAVTYWYNKKMEKPLCLKHPKTFNEKIQWLKLYDRNPLKTKLADKYEVRAWIKEKIGEEYLIPLLGVWDRFEDIDFDKLPNQFVLKANHGCGMNIIVMDKSKFDKKDAKQKFKRWLSLNFAFFNGYELQYKDIKPKIIAERIIDIDFEYKIFCSNGKVLFALLEFENNTKRAVYDENFNALDFSIGTQEKIFLDNKPVNFDKIINIAKNLSKDFYQVRVDFYSLKDTSIKFGEMTFTSCSGASKWSSEDVNLKLGSYIHLPCDN